MAEPAQPQTDAEKQRLQVEAVIKQIQTAEKLPVTGVLDDNTTERIIRSILKRTENAAEDIKTFQRTRKIPETGVIDQATKDSLRSLIQEDVQKKVQPAPAPPATADHAKRAELAAAPLRTFQTHSGLSPTGVMDDPTKKEFTKMLGSILDGFMDAAKGYIELEIPGGAGKQPTTVKIAKDGSIFRKVDGKYEEKATGGNATDPTNPVAASLVYMGAGKLEEESRETLRNQRLLSIDQAERRVAGKLTSITGGDVDQVLAEVRRADSVREVSDYLKKLLGPNNDKAIDHFAQTLYNLKMAETSAQNPDFTGFFADSDAYKRAAAANDAINALALGATTDTLHDRTTPDITKLPRVYGRLFDSDELYKVVDPRSVDSTGQQVGDYRPVINGALIGEANTLVDKNYIYQRAVERFEAAAHAAGIETKDISKALLDKNSGFHPPMEDLDMVYKGLSLVGDDKRTAEWNRRYGKIEDIGPITTIVTLGRENDPDYKQQDLTIDGKGLLARETTRRDPRGDMGITVNPATFSVYDYLQGKDAGAGHKMPDGTTEYYSFRRDYRNLSKLYSEELTLKDSGLYNPDIKALEKTAGNAPAPAPVADAGGPAADLVGAGAAKPAAAAVRQ